MTAKKIAAKKTVVQAKKNHVAKTDRRVVKVAIAVVATHAIQTKSLKNHYKRICSLSVNIYLAFNKY